MQKYNDRDWQFWFEVVPQSSKTTRRGVSKSSLNFNSTIIKVQNCLDVFLICLYSCRLETGVRWTQEASGVKWSTWGRPKHLLPAIGLESNMMNLLANMMACMISLPLSIVRSYSWNLLSRLHIYIHYCEQMKSTRKLVTSCTRKVMLWNCVSKSDKVRLYR